MIEAEILLYTSLLSVFYISLESDLKIIFEFQSNKCPDFIMQFIGSIWSCNSTKLGTFPHPMYKDHEMLYVLSLAPDETKEGEQQA